MGQPLLGRISGRFHIIVLLMNRAAFGAQLELWKRGRDGKRVWKVVVCETYVRVSANIFVFP